MAAREDYVDGTVSINNGAKVITGSGTAWALRDFRSGDLFLRDSYVGVINTVDSDTQITLVDNWAGPTLSGATYRLRYMGDAQRTAGWTRDLVDLLGNGNLQAFSGLSGSNNKLPMFSGPGALILVDKSDLTQGVDYDVVVNELADRDAYDDQLGPTASARGFTVLVADIGDGRAALYSKLSDTSGDWSDPVFIAAKTVMDILVDDPGNPGAGEVVLTANITRDISFLDDMAGSVASVVSNPDDVAVYSFKKNGTEFATMSISTGGICTFSGTETAFTAGDKLTVVAPNPRNPTLGGISMTLSATR